VYAIKSNSKIKVSQMSIVSVLDSLPKLALSVDAVDF